MHEMVERIIRANKLDLDNVKELGTDECFIDDSIRNLSDLDIVYRDFVKGSNDQKLVADFQSDFLGWATETKFIVETTKQQWEETQQGNDSWDYPEAELSDILNGNLSDPDCEVYAQFKDDDGEVRFGEMFGYDVDTAKAVLHSGRAVAMEQVANP